jgi:hypothetical protein
MTDFVIYPGIDEEFAFPPAVRQAIADSPELSATILDKIKTDSVPKWKATTAYLAGEKVLSPAGDVVSAKVNFTSGASYDAANWDLSTNVAGKLDKTEAATTYAGKAAAFDVSGLFGGINGFMYGNSWLAVANYSATQYPVRLTSKLGLASMGNLATSGYRMQDTAIIAVKAGAKQWTAGTKGVVVVGDLLNNLIEADDAVNRATALESCRALVALLQASSRIEQTAFTLSTTPYAWVNAASTQGYASGGTLALVGDVDGAYADITVGAGTQYLLLHGADGTTLKSGKITIMQGATNVGEKVLNGVARTTTYNTNGLAPVVVKISGHTAGTVRATYTLDGRTGTNCFLDALLPQSTTPPLVVLVKPPQVSASSHTAGKANLLTYLRTIPDTVAAEFPNVVVVDPHLYGWDPATCLGADLLHPNELGQETMANAVVSTIKAEMLKTMRQTRFGTLA